MSKIRVYELAHKMGIDNKDLIARLHAIGVEVKSHTSVIEEAVANKLTAPPQVKDENKDEVRVTTTVIRRRAKHITPSAEEPLPPAVSAEAAPPLPIEATAPEPEMEKEPEAPAETEVLKEVAKTAPPEIATPEVPLVKEAAEDAHHGPRAKILGRVELPIPQTKERPTERREPYRPPPRGAERGAAAL